VDGAGGQTMFPRMWQRIQPLVDGSIVVSLDQVRHAMRLMAEKARVISEGAGALPIAAALTGKAGQGPIVAIVSGGNIDLRKFFELIEERWRVDTIPAREGRPPTRAGPVDFVATGYSMMTCPCGTFNSGKNSLSWQFSLRPMLAGL
jgi:hypothetical protein